MTARLSSQESTTATGEGALLSVERLRFRYGGGSGSADAWLLRIDDFSIMPDTAYSLEGDNMTGKSTLIRLLTGAMPEMSADAEGAVDLGTGPMGVPISAVAAREAGMVAVHQKDVLFGSLSVWENVLLGARSSRTARDGTAAARKLLEAQMTAIRVGSTVSTGDPLDTLSGGGRAIVRLVRAIAWGFRVLFLDEATTNLDVANRELFFDIVASGWKASTSVVLVSHHASDHQRLRDVSAVLGKRYSHLLLRSGVVAPCE